MSNEDLDKKLGEHEKFKEWCALVSTGDLTAAEQLELHRHLAVCEECRVLLACSNEGLALRRMAALAAVRDPISAPDPETRAWDEEAAKLQLLAAVASGHTSAPPDASRPAPGRSGHWRRSLGVALGTAAVLLLSVSFAYQSGYHRGRASTPSGPAIALKPIAPPGTRLRQEVAKLEEERAALEQQLAADRSRINALAVRVTWQEKQVAGWKNSYASLAAQNQLRAATIASDADAQMRISRRLANAQSSLTLFRNYLTSANADYQRARLRATSLETQIGELSTRLREKNETINKQRRFLVEDRDIRDLMGARHLYIADVFDVNGSGKTRKAFGRVFYTKHKSLIFYAFDLGKREKHREVKVFQAWGTSGLDDSKPVSLGIFYMDDKTMRRWVLRSDNPKVLANLDAVFVTTEPKGGSKKPSGKPFLFAYLHKAPINHF